MFSSLFYFYLLSYISNIFCHDIWKTIYTRQKRNVIFFTNLSPLQKILQRYQQELSDWEDRYRGTTIYLQIETLQLEIQQTKAKLEKLEPPTTAED